MEKGSDAQAEVIHSCVAAFFDISAFSEKGRIARLYRHLRCGNGAGRKKYFENFALTLPKQPFPFGIEAKGVRKPPPAVREGGELLLELTPSQKKTVRHQFDSFLRKVLREEARDYIRHITWRASNEVSLSELSEAQLDKLYVMDEYPCELFRFPVQGTVVTVKDEKLAAALSALPDEKREIVLLSYFLEMTDQEIADKLKLVRRTIQYRRTSTLKEMKQRMEAIDDGEQAD